MYDIILHLKNKDGMFNVIKKFSYQWVNNIPSKILTTVCIPYVYKPFHEIPLLKNFLKS